MLLERLATLLHLDERNRFPNQIGERGAAAVFLVLADAEFRLPAGVQNAGMAKGMEKPVEEDLRLAFFIAGDVLLGPVDEVGEFGAVGHAVFVAETAGELK
jgi:hypothetical protein